MMTVVILRMMMMASPPSVTGAWRPVGLRYPVAGATNPTVSVV